MVIFRVGAWMAVSAMAASSATVVEVVHMVDVARVSVQLSRLLQWNVLHISGM